MLRQRTVYNKISTYVQTDLARHSPHIKGMVANGRIWLLTNFFKTFYLILDKYVPISNLVCIKEVAIRITFSHVINRAGIFYYTCSLVIDIECTRYKNASRERFRRIVWESNSAEICSEKNLKAREGGYIMQWTSGYVSI